LSRTWSRTTRLTQIPPGSAKASRRGDIDAVAVNVLLVDDDVAEIDADAELDAALLGDAVIAQRDLVLDFDGTTHRIDDAGEFDQQPVAGGLDDAAAVLGDLGIRQLAPQRRQSRERTFLVVAHQTRVAGDIGCEDRREPAFDARSAFGVHRGGLPSGTMLKQAALRRQPRPEAR
jgi:hypothetical protein